jgi:uncharacterized protein YjbJ (UPF0337 family)
LDEWVSAQTLEEARMNRDRIAGEWKQLAGALRRRWGLLTDDDFEIIAGDLEILVGKIQERYGIALDEARKQVAEFAHGHREAEQARRKAKEDANAVAIEGDPVDMDTLRIGMP